jgi:hypothetical protein
MGHALAEGRISREHVDSILRILRKIPEDKLR